MTEVVSFTRTPPARYDDVPWESVRVEEAATADGTWATIDTITFLVPDPDPSDPGVRSFTTSNGTDVNQWYRIVWVDGAAGESLPSFASQNTTGLLDIAATPYSTVEELARILHIRQPTPAQELALERVLEAAALEINAELGRSAPFADPPPELVVEVNLERAVEHWKQEEAAFGIVGLGSETGAFYTARDSWDRHALKLAPLKESWGIG